jgi:hypothetical protein
MGVNKVKNVKPEIGFCLWHRVLDIVVIVGICVFKPKIRVGEKIKKILENFPKI